MKIFFQTLEAIFPYKGVFVTKVVKANIIAFIKTKILRPVLSVTNPPFQKCQPLLHSAMYLLISDGSISNLVMCLGLTRVACCSRSKMISRNRMEAGAILLRMRHGAGHINDIAAILIQYH